MLQEHDTEYSKLYKSLKQIGENNHWFMKSDMKTSEAGS